ncbi:hypothetical protein NPIL_91391 [Nephila pilipes]|uniref:Uncharacterized protein n=1 Tax=Nephila pilipes TaxID=299642 RepID=A0A8X6TN01_NEPPI|nr:hypothetical protein NPIL_91391 [Nephila pilipes]
MIFEAISCKPYRPKEMQERVTLSHSAAISPFSIKRHVTTFRNDERQAFNEVLTPVRPAVMQSLPAWNQLPLRFQIGFVPLENATTLI